MAKKPGSPKSAPATGASQTPSEKTGKKKPGDDVVLVHGRGDDGALQILRKKGDTLSAGELRPIEDGKPLTGGSVVTLAPRKELPILCDVVDEVEVPGGAKAAKKSPGPARVSNPRYRAGWKSVFGKKRGASKPN